MRILDPGSEMEKILIRDKKKFWSGINISDPQHCISYADLNLGFLLIKNPDSDFIRKTNFSDILAVWIGRNEETSQNPHPREHIWNFFKLAWIESLGIFSSGN